MKRRVNSQDPMNKPVERGCPETEQYPVVRNEQDFFSRIETRLREEGLELFETAPGGAGARDGSPP